MTKYKCVKGLSLEIYDDDGSFVENEHFEIEVGSVWERVEDSYRFIASAESIRLSDSNGRWMEIYDDNLANHFVQI